MGLTPEALEKMNRATNDLSEIMAKPLMDRRAGLEQKYDLTPPQLNLAVAHAAIVLAASSTGHALDLGEEDARAIHTELLEVLNKRITKGPTQ